MLIIIRRNLWEHSRFHFFMDKVELLEQMKKTILSLVIYIYIYIYMNFKLPQLQSAQTALPLVHRSAGQGILRDQLVLHTYTRK